MFYQVATRTVLEVFEDHSVTPENPRAWYTLGEFALLEDATGVADVQVDSLQEYKRQRLIDCGAVSQARSEGVDDEVLDALFEEHFVSLPIWRIGPDTDDFNTLGKTHCFDDTPVGLISVNIKHAKGLFDWKNVNLQRLRKLRDMLAWEIDAYSHFLQKRFYGFRVRGEVLNPADGDWMEDGAGVVMEETGFLGPNPEKNDMGRRLPQGWQSKFVLALT